MLKIDFNMDQLKEQFRNSGFDGKVYLVDPEGQIRFSNDSRTENASFGELYGEIEFPNKTIRFDRVYSGINYLEGWSLQGVMDEEIVLQEVRKSRSLSSGWRVSISCCLQ